MSCILYILLYNTYLLYYLILLCTIAQALRWDRHFMKPCTRNSAQLNINVRRSTSTIFLCSKLGIHSLLDCIYLRVVQRWLFMTAFIYIWIFYSNSEKSAFLYARQLYYYSLLDSTRGTIYQKKYMQRRKYHTLRTPFLFFSFSFFFHNMRTLALDEHLGRHLIKPQKELFFDEPQIRRRLRSFMHWPCKTTGI